MAAVGACAVVHPDHGAVGRPALSWKLGIEEGWVPDLRRSGLGNEVLSRVMGFGMWPCLGAEVSVHHRMGTCLGPISRLLLQCLWFPREAWGQILLLGAPLKRTGK